MPTSQGGKTKDGEVMYDCILNAFYSKFDQLTRLLSASTLCEATEGRRVHSIIHNKTQT